MVLPRLSWRFTRAWLKYKAHSSGAVKRKKTEKGGRVIEIGGQFLYFPKQILLYWKPGAEQRSLIPN